MSVSPIAPSSQFKARATKIAKAAPPRFAQDIPTARILAFSFAKQSCTRLPPFDFSLGTIALCTSKAKGTAAG